jgi:signal transduction histidine kinase
MSRRLYLQLYLALLMAAAVSLLAVSVVFRLLGEPVGAPAERLRGASGVLVETLRGVPDAELEWRLVELGNELSVELAVWNQRGVLIASATRRPLLPPRKLGPGWTHGRLGLQLFVPISVDRIAGLRSRHRGPRLPLSFASGLLLLAFVIAVGSYPVARRMTKRLETLAAGVARWGAGDLAHRVPVEGKDEVAILAATFNRAAAQVDELVAQQRQTLANASHELRSPLARLQMALTLVADEERPERRAELIEGARQDIVDLDALIEELLLMARADGRTPRRPFETVDLLALLQAEAARVGALVEGVRSSVQGDPLLLRHLLRNLLENAKRYGQGKEIRAVLEAGDDAVTLAVEDRGPGISEQERERIFAPFYRLPGAEGAVQGVGLGLSLVRQVARYHRGEARVLARAGGGSRFEVTLPRISLYWGLPPGLRWNATMISTRRFDAGYALGSRPRARATNTPMCFSSGPISSIFFASW